MTGKRKYTVEAWERIGFHTYYYDVEADSPEEAVQLCRDGDVDEDERKFVDGDVEWVETISVKEDTTTDGA